MYVVQYLSALMKPFFKNVLKMFVIVSVQEYQPIYLDIGMKKKGGRATEVRGNLNSEFEYLP